MFVKLFEIQIVCYKIYIEVPDLKDVNNLV